MEKYALYRELLNLPELYITDVVLSGHKIVIACCLKSDVTECTCPKCGKPTSCVNQEHIQEVRDAAIADHPRLGILYHQREAFHHILDNAQSVQTATEKRIQWKIDTIKKGITEFDAFIKMLNTKQELVVNYVTNYLSNAVTEGLNNLIRSIRRVSFGMTNFQNLRWRVLAISV